MELSAETAASLLPSGLKRTHQTASEWSVMVCAHAREERSQSFTVESEEPVTRAAPSGEAVRDKTQLL